MCQISGSGALPAAPLACLALLALPSRGLVLVEVIGEEVKGGVGEVGQALHSGGGGGGGDYR